MNKEYRKFDEPADIYIPPATEPGHFSNLPDVLIPSDYHEEDGDPLEKDVADLIRETATPPPTPPELEPGRAGCRVFREVKHYVAPIYQDPEYQRLFAIKLMLGNMLSYVPTVIAMVCIMTIEDSDYLAVRNIDYLYIALGLSFLASGVYVYFVGLFRNRPMYYIAFGIRTALNTSLFSCSMLIIHVWFLKITAHPTSKDEELNETTTVGKLGNVVSIEQADHGPPYMTCLIVGLMGSVLCIISLMLYKFKFSVTDYRIPFIIYTSCFSTSSILVTIILNNGFNQEPLAYDLFQVMFGCYIGSMMLMRTPHFVGRLFDGKVCPLREDEIWYALIHYGL